MIKMKNITNNIIQNKWLVAILIISAFLRFFHLDYQSIWMDEIYTMNISNPNASFSTMISEVTFREGFPYLYFIIINIFHHIFGYEPIVARSFSAIMGVLSVYMIYRFGKQLFSKNAGLIAATLVAFSEYCIYTSQDARPYTFYFFSVLLSFYGLVAFLKERTVKRAIIYGVFSGILLNTNFFSVINLFSQSIIILFFLGLCPANERLKFFKNAIVAGGIAILMFAINYKLLMKLMVFKSSWIAAPTNESISLIFKEFLGGSEITLFIFIPLFFYFLVNIFKTKDIFTYEGVINNKKTLSFIILAPWVVVCVLIIVLKSYLDTSLMVTRYFISVLPVFFLIFAISIEFIVNRIIRFSILSILLLFMLTNNVAIKHYYTSASKTQFREAAEFVMNNNKKEEPVYTSLKYWYDYFFIKGNAKFPVIDTPSIDVVINEMMQDTTKIKAFWYVDAHGRPIVLSETAQNFVNEKFYVENSFDGLDAWARHYILLKDVPKTIDISKFNTQNAVNGDIFKYSIETYEDSNNIIKATGWAYFENQDSSPTSIDLVLIKESVAIRLNTQKVTRPDVTSYFKLSYNANNSGFNSVMDASQLPVGNYVLAIYLKNEQTKKVGLMLTDKKVIKN